MSLLSCHLELGQIVRPAIADKLGYVIFIGTPMGHNHFWEVYDLAKWIN